MKKTLTVAALSSALVLGMAASALAVHETATAETPTVAAGASKITIDGGVRERGVYDKNDASEDSPANNYYDSRVELGVKAQVSPEAAAYLKLQSGPQDNDLDYWGDGRAAGLHTGGLKLGTPTILESWVNYQPGAWGVKAGHMPLALGNKIFFDHTKKGDDALVFYANPTDATHIAALTIKFDEQYTNDNSDDLDGYVALVTQKVNDNLNLGANWTYLRGGSDRGGSIPGWAFDGTTGDLQVSPMAVGYELAAGMAMSNIGLTADGKVGAISYLADLEFQFGDVANYDNGTDTTTVDAGGWAMKLGGNYDFGAGKVGLLFGYGSGDDDKSHLDELADGKDLSHDAYINFLTDTNYDTIIAGYRAAIPGANSWASPAGTGSSTGKNTGLANLTLFQLNGSTKTVCPLTGKDLSIFGSVSYMKLSEDMINGTDKNADANEVDSVGTEVDLIATWQLTAGLNYKVEAAYLWTGDVYEVSTLGHSTNADNLAFLRHSLEVKF